MLQIYIDIVGDDDVGYTSTAFTFIKRKSDTGEDAGFEVEPHCFGKDSLTTFSTKQEAYDFGRVQAEQEAKSQGYDPATERIAIKELES